MSTRGLRGTAPIGYTRSSRRKKAGQDLNVPPNENLAQEGTSTRTNFSAMAPGQAGGSVPPATIDVEAFEDDVIISSPRAFAEAKNNSRRTRGSTVVVDVDSVMTSSIPGRAEAPVDSHRTEESTSRVVSYKRRRPRRANTNNQQPVIDLESTSNSVRQKPRAAEVATPPPPPPPPPAPKEPVFSCPVCMGSLVEETSTKCGHIFCKKCIKSAVSAQKKCPTCRRKMTMKDTIRIYLPTTN